MKITKQRLKQIIKEEVETLFADVDTPSLKDVQDELQQAGQYSKEAALYKYLKDNGFDAQGVFAALKTVPTGNERTEVARRLGINLDSKIEIRGYRTGGLKPAPIRPALSRWSIGDVVINVQDDKLLHNEMEELDKRITKAHKDFGPALKAAMNTKPADPQAALRYGPRNKLGP
jgi:hypothetical protein